MSDDINCVKHPQEEPKETPYNEPKGSEHVENSARDSIVGIGTSLHAERSRFRIPARRINFSLLQKSRESYSTSTGVQCRGKAAGT